MNTGEHTSFQVNVFVFFGQIPRSKIARSCGNFIFNFLENFITFPIVCVPIYNPLLFLQLKVVPLLFILLNFLCFYKFRWNCYKEAEKVVVKGTVTYCGLRGVFLCGNVPLQTLCTPYLWWRAGFDMDSTHIFPQDVLAVITLVGSVAGDKEAKACRVWGGLPIYSVSITMGVCSQGARVEALRVEFQLVLFPLGVCFSSFPPLGPLPQRIGVLKPRMLMCPQKSCGCLQIPSDTTHSCVFSLVMPSADLVLCYVMEWVGLKHSLGLGWSAQWGGHRNLAAVLPSTVWAATWVSTDNGHCCSPRLCPGPPSHLCIPK